MYVPNISCKVDNDINIVEPNTWIIYEKELEFPLVDDVFIFQFPNNINICINNIWLPVDAFDFFYPLYITPSLSCKMEIYDDGKITNKIKVWCIDLNGYDMVGKLTGMIGYQNKLVIDYNDNTAKYGRCKYSIYQILYDRILLNRRSNTMNMLDRVRDNDSRDYTRYREILYDENDSSNGVTLVMTGGSNFFNSILNDINQM